MRSQRQRAFTLVELLVVVAVIALLLGILLPVLSRARDAARLTVCLNNARQITLAAVAYTHDNGDSWPVVPLRETAFSVSFNSWKYGGKTNSDYWKQGSGINHVPIEDRPLNPYLASEDGVLKDNSETERLEMPIFRCPSDAGTYQRQFWNGDTYPDSRITSYDDVGTSYHMNVKWWYTLLPTVQPPPQMTATKYLWSKTRHMFRQANFNRPSHFVWCHDQTMDFVSETPNSRTGDHKGLNKATALFMDGHCEYLLVEPDQPRTGRYTLLFDEGFVP